MSVSVHEMPHVALLGLHHEANTFCPIRADLSAFRDGGLFVDGEIGRMFGSSRSTIGGFYAAARDGGLDLEPLVFARVNPCGPITEEAYDHIADLMLRRLEQRGPWDGVLLAWHGAAVADGRMDADGDLLRLIRELVGQRVPIGAVLDMHANVSSAMAKAVDVLIGYRTNPHVDAEMRGRECAELINQAIVGAIAPVSTLCPIPLAANIIRQGTSDEPMRGLLAHAEELATQGSVLAVSLFEGFPYADVPHMGMSAVAVADRDRQAAEHAAKTLAMLSWEAREGFLGRAEHPDDAVKMAAIDGDAPMVLFDVGDNIGAGAPGDSVVLLASADRLGVSGIVQTINDPIAVSKCLAAGTGGRVGIDVGGKRQGSPAPPHHVTGFVRRLTDGRFEELGQAHGGFRYFDSGPTALLETDKGQRLILTSRLVPNTSLQQLHSVGLDPSNERIIVAKGVHAPRAAYERVAAEMVWVDTPGVTRMSIKSLKYQHRRHPLYPFEDDVSHAGG